MAVIRASFGCMTMLSFRVDDEDADEVRRWAQALGVSRATVICLHVAQCHAGMRCPHHNCREMHQSWMLRIHSK